MGVLDVEHETDVGQTLFGAAVVGVVQHQHIHRRHVLRHVKPHGALNNVACADPVVAASCPTASTASACTVTAFRRWPLPVPFARRWSAKATGWWGWIRWLEKTLAQAGQEAKEG